MVMTVLACVHQSYAQPYTYALPSLPFPSPLAIHPHPLKGIEDALGNMDFKVAGTRTGVTFMQVCQLLGFCLGGQPDIFT